MEAIMKEFGEKTSLIFRMKNIPGYQYTPYWEYESHPEYIEVTITKDYQHKIDKMLRTFSSKKEFIESKSFQIAHLLRIKAFPITPTRDEEENQKNIDLFLESGEIYYIENGIRKDALFVSEEDVVKTIMTFCHSFSDLIKFYKKEKMMPEEYQSLFGNDEKMILETEDRLFFGIEFSSKDMYSRLKNSNRYYSLYRYLTNGHLDDDSLIDIPYQEFSFNQEEITQGVVLKQERIYTAPYADN